VESHVSRGRCSRRLANDCTAGEQGSKARRAAGFTLIEVVIVIALLAIVATLALPAYRVSVYKANRSDGLQALLDLQTRQEKWRANNPSYTDDLADLGYSASTSAEGRYTLSLAEGATGTSYTATATAVGDQSNDRQGDTSCAALTMTVNPANPRGLKAPASCWSR
jgi:type IV pilus assembly protein PilE